MHPHFTITFPSFQFTTLTHLHILTTVYFTFLPFPSLPFQGEWSVSHPGSFTHGEGAPGIHWRGGWVGSRADRDNVEERKIICLCRNRTPTIQTLAHRYTDWIISACYLNVYLYLQSIDFTLCLKATTKFRGKYPGVMRPLYSYRNLNSLNPLSSLPRRKFLCIQRRTKRIFRNIRLGRSSYRPASSRTFHCLAYHDSSYRNEQFKWRQIIFMSRGVLSCRDANSPPSSAIITSDWMSSCRDWVEKEWGENSNKRQVSKVLYLLHNWKKNNNLFLGAGRARRSLIKIKCRYYFH
jgi:hypothetical protein